LQLLPDGPARGFVALQHRPALRGGTASGSGHAIIWLVPCRPGASTGSQITATPRSRREPAVQVRRVGVGPVWLNAHPFTSVDELLEVPGIGQRRFEQLKDLVTVG
jgi:hypothetical protein